jgi:hypothetical protein
MGLRYRPGGLVFVSINPVAWIGYVSPISDGLVWTHRLRQSVNLLFAVR